MVSFDTRVPGFLGRVLDAGDAPVGTCFQVAPGVFVTAWHVLDDVEAGEPNDSVRLDPLAGGAPFDGRVARVDPLHDLAVVQAQQALPASIGGLAATDSVPLLTGIVITGVPEVADDPGHAFRHLDATGRWQGALEIKEELGDRAGTARTVSQLGVLLTERGDVEDAVGYNVRSLALRLDIGSPDAQIDVHGLRRQQELLGDARFDALLRTQLDETSIANLKDYLSSAAPDDQGLQRHLSQWEPVIAAVVGAVEGDDDGAATLRPLLDQLGATSDWGALVAVLRRILAGERGEQLLAGLDAVDTEIARETLRRLSG